MKQLIGALDLLKLQSDFDSVCTHSLGRSAIINAGFDGVKSLNMRIMTTQEEMAIRGGQTTLGLN